jgi:hypothetical protein
VDEKTLARFLAKVDKRADGCWLWTGVRTRGYGRLTLGTRKDGSAYAHRLSYEHFVGPIANGICVCHRCDVPACVNPEHLFLGTHAENMADMAAKGRHYSLTKPDRVARGDRHASRTSPALIARGERCRTAKVTAQIVREIRAMCAGGMAQNVVAKRFGVRATLVNSVVHRKSWKHI